MPFRLSVFTDDHEQTADAAAMAAVAKADVNEASAGVLLTPTGKAMKSSPHLGPFGYSEFWGLHSFALNRVLTYAYSKIIE